MNNFTIYTDVDDSVLCCSDAMQAFLQTKGHVITSRMRDHHNIPKLFNLELPEALELIREFHRSPAMGELEPEPCAQQVLPALYRRGVRFVAISACLNEPDVVRRRTENLERVFGFKWEAIQCLGLTLDKTAALRAHAPGIWVEDMWHHAVAGAEAGHRAFLLDRPYNRGHTHPAVTRVHDWYEIARLIGPQPLA